MRLNLFQIICLVFLIILFVFWIILFISGEKASFLNYLYSFLFGLIPLIGGLTAMFNAKIWGGMKSSIGKAVFFIGLGLFLWGSGETIWSYYNFFLNEPAPYPSLADIGFAPSIFFYGLGAIYLSHATGARFGLRNKLAKVFLFITPILVFGLSYFILVQVARGGVLISPGEPLLKAILDLAYPLGDFLALTISIIISGLSFKYFGGKYVFDIASILSGLAVMFIADSIFSYTTTIGTFYNGSVGDLTLTIGLFLITFGILGFCQKIKTVEAKSQD